MENLAFHSAKEIRQLIRAGEITGHTTGMAKGFTQANVVILKKELAFDFLLFCQRNPKSCPLIEVTDAGSFTLDRVAKHADIRIDVPRYRIYQDGELVNEVTNITSYWEDDMVVFLLGCSFTFESALTNNNIPVRHNEDHCNVPMYKTNLPTERTGSFSGPMVVSMRPMSRTDAIRATQVTSRFPAVHGSPIHIGEPAEIGIKNIHQPDFGDAVSIKENEVPVFWACGVTPQAAAIESKPALMITHSPGCMFISDIKDDTLSMI